MNGADRPSRDAATRVPLNTLPQDAVALARYALGGGTLPSQAGVTLSRHLAFLPNDALTLDLDDPMQRDFGEYELTALLGQGGMGVVYRARQKGLDRDVAVKLLAAGPWASADFIERFRREAQSAARMTHPNIVPIYEIGQHAEINFFSMRLVEGPSLATVLERDGPMAPRAAAVMLRIVAEAVDYAHRLGVLHLDLKPGNVLVDPSGEPQVADFGLARRLDDTLSAEATEVSGTPSYMAPEQAELRRHRLSPATDIWGLGAILYEMLTGRPPFLAANAAETLRRVVTQEAERPSRHREDVPVDLEAICLKCLSKNPVERYASARALADDLGRYVEGRPVSVRPLSAGQRAVRWVRREPQLALTAGAFVFALVAGLTATAVQWRRADANAHAAEANLWASRGQVAQDALADGDGFRGLRLLVDNLAEMERAGRTDEARIERMRIGLLLANTPRLVDAHALGTGELITALALSPDGRRVAVATVGNGMPRRVREIELASGEVRWVLDTAGVTRGLASADRLPHEHLRYTDDGTRLGVQLSAQAPFALPMMTDSLLIDAERGVLVSPPESLSPWSDLAFSGDFRTALVRFRTDASLRIPDQVQVYAVDGWRALTPRLGTDITGAVADWMFDPTGAVLIGAGDFASVSSYDPVTFAVRWTVATSESDPVRAWRFSADGSALALGTQSGRVMLVDPRDGRAEALPATPSTRISWLEFSADGRTLAAIGDGDEIMAWDVATRRPRTTLLHSGIEQKLASVRIDGDSLWSVANTEVRAWTLPPLARFDNAAVPASARLRSGRAFWPHGFDFAPAAGLLASGDADGAIRVWQPPPSPILTVAAAPLPTRTLGFDGRHVVAVDGRTVFRHDVVSGTDVAPRWQHPEPVHFAALTADGGRLATIAGRTLRVFDAATGDLVGTPSVLPQTPIRAEIARTAPVLVVGTLDHDADGMVETLASFDLATGAMRTRTRVLHRLIGEITVDPQANWVRASQPDSTDAAAVVEFLALDDGADCSITLPAGHLPGDLAAVDGRTAWLHVATLAREHKLHHIDLGRCTTVREIALGVGPSMPRLRAHVGGVVVHRQLDSRLASYADDGSLVLAPAPPVSETMVDFTVSEDGELAAVATRNGVQVIHLRRGERLSPVMPAPLAGNDAIGQLAFAPDARRLLARSVRGRWITWALPEATAATAQLAELADLLDPAVADVPAAITAVLRARLRAASEPPTQALPEVRDDDLHVLASATEPDARYAAMRFGTAANVRLDGDWPLASTTGGDWTTIARGPVRLAGVDWWLDGAVQLSRGAPTVAIHPNHHATPAIEVPVGDWKRVHVLMLLHVPLRPTAPPREALRVVLVGRDGREHVLAPLTQRDVIDHWQSPRTPASRVAWIGVFPASSRGGSAPAQTWSRVYTIALPIPVEAGPLAAVRLEAPDGPMEAPLVYGLTLERVDATAD